MSSRASGKVISFRNLTPLADHFPSLAQNQIEIKHSARKLRGELRNEAKQRIRTARNRFFSVPKWLDKDLLTCHKMPKTTTL
jgi:hypothetical protein